MSDERTMIEHSDELTRELGEDLCPYHCVGCGLGFTYYRGSGLLICGECKTEHRIVWTWEDGWHIVAGGDNAIANTG